LKYVFLPVENVN